MGICDTSIRIRIDSTTKEKAAGALEKMGLSVSDAVRMLLVRVGESGRLPFAVEIPNAATRESIAELEEIAAALPDITLVANMVETGRTPLLTPAELADLGFRLIVSPLSVLFATVKADQDGLRTLRTEGAMRDHLDQLVGFEAFTDLVDLPRHRELEQHYARKESPS